MTLLEAQAMDLTFNTKDVIYIITLVVGGIIGWFNMRLESQKQSDKISVLDEKFKTESIKNKEDHINASNGRKAIKKEGSQELKDKEQILHARIDRLRDENIKSYEKLEKRLEEMEKKQESHTLQIINAIQNKQ